MSEALKLRKLAFWLREQAERAGITTIWDSRLRTAETLEEEAEQLESRANLPLRRAAQQQRR